MTEPNGIPNMPCVYQSFTNLSGEYPEIPFQSARKLVQSWRCEHEEIGSSGTPDKALRDHIKVSVGHKPAESMDRRDLRRLPSQLPYLKQNQQDCSPSRF